MIDVVQDSAIPCAKEGCDPCEGCDSSRMPVRETRVTVVGMGKSGMAAAVLLARAGARVRVLDDQKVAAPSWVQPPGEAYPIQFRFGAWEEEDFLDSDRVVVSPGVPLSKLPMQALRARNIPVMGEMELAAAWLSAPILAITGTNGKSTTTTLVGEMLKSAGWRVFVGGNLGTPLCEAAGSDWDFIVAEASSFQLETVQQFRPRIAALLNITPDHLDRYPDMAAYQRAKWRIFENQTARDHAILNADDPQSIPPILASRRIAFSRTHVPERGVYLRHGEIYSNLWGKEESVIKIERLRIKGVHQVENVMAAVAMALLCSAPIAGIRQVLMEFRGLPHRMEFIRTVRGAQYINDSKGTNVGAVLKSLEGMTAPVILIAGGKEKGCDFHPLNVPIRKKVKRLILMGEAAEKMAQSFALSTTIERANSMEEAVQMAASFAAPGDVVLLAPACASFDMFRDYQDRGDHFRRAVAALSP